MRFFFASVVSLLLVSSPILAQSSVTGTWSGEFVLTDRCDNGGTFTSRGIASAALVQSGSTVMGILVLNDLRLTDGRNCIPGPTETVRVPISGTISGGAIVGTLTAPGPQSIPFTGTISSGSMTISFGQEVTSGTITLAQTGTTAPDSQLTGSWSGTYTITNPPEAGCPALSFSGAASGTFFQAGADFSGFLSVFDTSHYDPNPDGTCRLHEHVDEVFYLSGTVSGNSVIATGSSLDSENSEGEGIPFNFTVAGDTITGRVEGVATFTLQRSTSTPSPIVTSFDADPASISAGQSSTLRWNTFNATSVMIDNGVGAQAPSGSIAVRPRVTTTYTLTATGTGGSTIVRTTVTVGGGGTARLAIGTFPGGFAQLAGAGGGTDTFTISNIGEGPSTVTLVPAGVFFGITPTSFTLDPGASQTITITGTPQPAGFYEGSVSVSGAGAPAGLAVPVRMLSAAAPAGPATPAPAAARVEVASSGGQNVSGTVDFTSSGTATLQGIAVADVPWIIPQSGVISIAPGQRVAVTYMIDSTRRPDAGSPVGAVTGKLSLVYAGSGSGVSALGSGGSTSSVSVTIVHVARPTVSSGTPPPLTSGELALFMPGLGNRAGAVGDLLLANHQPAPLNNIEIFMRGAAAPSQSTSITQFLGNSSVVFPGLIRNVFNASVPSGTAQIRGAEVSKLSAAAILANTSLPAGTFSTALPVFRSDRGASAGARILLPGLLKNGSVQTHLYVQELSGADGSFLVEILDRDGNVLAARGPESIAAFGFVELLDVVPASGQPAARTARVTAAGGAAKLNAYGLVHNTTNGDAWLVVDTGLDAVASNIMVMPLLSAGSGAQTSLWVTNRSGAPVTATIEERGVGRRRAAAHSTSHAKTVSVVLEPQKTFTFEPNGTSGFLRIAAPAGTISAAARSTRDSDGGNVHGTGLPVVPAGGALRAGQVKRFMAVDDASAQSRARKVPATFATHLALIETEGQSVTVRITVQFAFASGSLVSSSAQASRQYSLAAGQFRLIPDLARDVIGSQRDSFGDLRNMTVDVQIVGGSGAVVPFLQSVDQGSGDTLVRIE